MKPSTKTTYKEQTTQSYHRTWVKEDLNCLNMSLISWGISSSRMIFGIFCHRKGLMLSYRRSIISCWMLRIIMGNIGFLTGIIFIRIFWRNLIWIRRARKIHIRLWRGDFFKWGLYVMYFIKFFLSIKLYFNFNSISLTQK